MASPKQITSWPRVSRSVVTDCFNDLVGSHEDYVHRPLLLAGVGKTLAARPLSRAPLRFDNLGANDERQVKSWRAILRSISLKG